jgi:hypothetical protein
MNNPIYKLQVDGTRNDPYSEKFKEILEQQTPKITLREKVEAFNFTARIGDLTSLQLFLDTQEINSLIKQLAIISASRFGHFKIIKKIIESGQTSMFSEQKLDALENSLSYNRNDITNILLQTYFSKLKEREQAFQKISSSQEKTWPLGLSKLLEYEEQCATKTNNDLRQNTIESQITKIQNTPIEDPKMHAACTHFLYFLDTNKNYLPEKEIEEIRQKIKPLKKQLDYYLVTLRISHTPVTQKIAELQPNEKPVKNLIIIISTKKPTEPNDPIIHALSLALIQEAAPIITTAQLLSTLFSDIKPSQLNSNFYKNFKFFADNNTQTIILIIPNKFITNGEKSLKQLGFSKTLIPYENPSYSIYAVDNFSLYITSLTDMFRHGSGYWNIYLMGHGISADNIANISIEDFRYFIEFLSKTICTHFLFYISCYAGGINMHTAYKEIQPNFVIAQGSKTESTSRAFNFNILTPEQQIFPIYEDENKYTDKQEALNKIRVPISFTRFFDALEKLITKKPLTNWKLDPKIPTSLRKDSWLIVLYYVCP